jgi:lysophospholipase L1-like esterase
MSDGGTGDLALSILRKLVAGQTSLSERSIAEGFQVTNTSVRADNTGTGYTVGQTLGGYAPPPGQAVYVDSITVTASKDVTIWIQRSNANLIANGGVPMLYPVSVGPTYGGTVSIPINDILAEGESFAYVLRNAVAQADSTNATTLAATLFTVAVGFHGRRITNDFDYSASGVMMAIGDSITNTTGPTYGAEFYDFQVKRWLAKQGKRYRVVRKGDGGWTTSHAYAAMMRGVFNIPQVDLITFMLGTNEASLAAFQANFPSFISWKQDFYPKAKMLFIGSPPRQDANEAGVLQPIRAYQSSTIAALNDPLIRFVSLANAFVSAGDTNYITNDTTTSTTRVHPNALGHAAMASVITGDLTASKWIL